MDPRKMLADLIDLARTIQEQIDRGETPDPTDEGEFFSLLDEYARRYLGGEFVPWARTFAAEGIVLLVVSEEHHRIARRLFAEVDAEDRSPPVVRTGLLPLLRLVLGGEDFVQTPTRQRGASRRAARRQRHSGDPRQLSFSFMP